ncbi:hypothetical protein OSB04_031102 [Centaurea solstitialis]|uniref:Uncharacterized protein n=1 Tax=Centaurea solstitialis TaxID=347529 RepID=A0AA38W5N2_9ASTR|nr:hypothetical protein OSB04_031102 [Centaurea solstitialis]
MLIYSKSEEEHVRHLQGVLGTISFSLEENAGSVPFLEQRAFICVNMFIMTLGMEQTVDSQPTKRSRVSWKNVNVVKTFLETCVLEIALNGKEGGSLKSLSRAKVAETLKDVHNFDVDRKQMRNHCWIF